MQEVRKIKRRTLLLEGSPFPSLPTLLPVKKHGHFNKTIGSHTVSSLKRFAYSSTQESDVHIADVHFFYRCNSDMRSMPILLLYPHGRIYRKEGLLLLLFRPSIVLGMIFVHKVFRIFAVANCRLILYTFEVTILSLVRIVILIRLVFIDDDFIRCIRIKTTVTGRQCCGMFPI